MSAAPLPASERVAAIRAVLERNFQPGRLEVVDDSHRHAGHAGARDGRGHFRVVIESPAFAGMSMLQAHRAIYRALDALMATDIHALSIQATTPTVE